MPSPIDLLYQRIYGHLPNKDGEAYERLTAAACKLLEPLSAVFHDSRIRGKFSQSLYQVDVDKTKDGVKSFGEAKDYTIDQRPVGRPDLQKLGGALPDTPMDKGVFFSATGYTKPAKQYAAKAEQITGKPIDLMEVRPIVAEDLEGRIDSIVIQIFVLSPNYTNAFMPVFTDEGRAKAATMPQPVLLNIENFVDEHRVTRTSLQQLTAIKYGEVMTEVSEGSFPLPGCYMEINGQLIGVHGLTYKIPHTTSVHEVSIKPNGEATLLIKDAAGSVDKVFTNVDLKKVSFTDTGEAVIH